MRGASAVSIWPATSSMSNTGIGPLCQRTRILLLAAIHLVLQRARHRAVVEDHLLEARAVVAQHAFDRIALAGNARREIGRRRRIERAAADRLPALHHARRIGLQHGRRRTGGRRAQHTPPSSRSATWPASRSRSDSPSMRREKLTPEPSG